MNKFRIIVAMFLLLGLKTEAATLDTLIQKSRIDKTSTVAVSVKDVNTGRTVYEYNAHKLMNPASALKVFTMKSAFNELGSDYTFKTTAFTDSSNNLYIKLGADPTLTTGTLKTFLNAVKAKNSKAFKDIVLDPSIIDNKQWGTGWMWDDDTNSYLPKYSPFSVNENKIELKIEPAKDGQIPSIKNKSPYLMIIKNNLKTGDNNLKFERQPWNTGDMTTISGTVNKLTSIKLPVDSPERYFIGILEEALSSAKVKYTGSIKVAPLPEELHEVTELSSMPLGEILAYTLKNSNNFYSEMIFKTAGGHNSSSQGSTEKAVNMFNKYYSSIKADKPVIVDACGISRNNLITVDWMTEALNKFYHEKNFTEFLTYLPKPIEGTLSNRLLDISLKLRAKTGTASGISSITGYIDTKTNRKYSFAVMIQNYSISEIEIKKFEDSIINEIYKL